LTHAFITYVRPLLEYNCVAWSPHLKREQVQCRFMKRLSGLSGYSYDERLKLFNLDNLQYRRTRLDIIMCYQIIFGFVCIDSDVFFQLHTSTTRGHPCKQPHHDRFTALFPGPPGPTHRPSGWAPLHPD